MNGDHSENVEGLINHLLSTRMGKIKEYPKYGTRLNHLLFVPVDSEMQVEVLQEIKKTLETWIPHIIVSEVKIIENNGDRISVLVKYTLCLTSTSMELVFTFSRTFTQ